MKRHSLSLGRTPTASRRRGASRSDLLVALGCAASALAVAVPVLGRVGIDSGEDRSLSNLRILAGAHEAYAQTFNGKQYGTMPEDAGLVSGSCTAYITSVACPPQVLLGQSVNGAYWGYFLGVGLCAQYGYPPIPGCGNWPVYKAIEFTGTNAGIGSFRLGNATAFNSFVDGRFYSDTFYSPNDRVTYELSARYRDPAADFESFSQEIGFSSYCLSPAAMMNPEILASANGGYRNPDTFVEGYTSPSVAQCVYPELKTRMIEHHWNVGAPSFSALPPTNEPPGWLFNASVLASPNGFFFDGHVGRIRNAHAMADDAQRQQTEGIGLWSRTTPLGEAGYVIGEPTPEGVTTSHTILTIDGILGRDLLTPQ